MGIFQLFWDGSSPRNVALTGAIYVWDSFFGDKLGRMAVFYAWYSVGRALGMTSVPLIAMIGVQVVIYLSAILGVLYQMSIIWQDFLPGYFNFFNALGLDTLFLTFSTIGDLGAILVSYGTIFVGLPLLRHLKRFVDVNEQASQRFKLVRGFDVVFYFALRSFRKH